MIKEKKATNELLKGGLTLFIALNTFNLLNYFFHFTMARMLSVSDYGVLAVLMSLIYFFGVLGNATQTISSKYTSKFNAKKEYGKIKRFFFLMIKKGIYVPAAIFLIFLIVSFPLSSFLKINLKYLFITNLFAFSIFFVAIARGILQGQKKFKHMGVNMISEGLIKLALAVFLVWIGFGVAGALSSVVVASFLAFFLALIYFKNIFREKEKDIKIKGIYRYSTNVFVAMLGIVVLYSIDIILARRFFSPELAGKYAVASMIGKMVFFGTYGISQGMFPIVSEKHEKKEKTYHLFRKSLLIVLGLGMAVALLVFLFPSLIIKILFGSKYVSISNILIYIVLAYTFMSLTNVSVFYSLRKNTNKTIYFIILAVISEILAISIFNKNIISYSISLATINLLIFLSSLLIIKDEK